MLDCRYRFFFFCTAQHLTSHAHDSDNDNGNGNDNDNDNDVTSHHAASLPTPHPHLMCFSDADHVSLSISASSGTLHAKEREACTGVRWTTVSCMDANMFARPTIKFVIISSAMVSDCCEQFTHIQPEVCGGAPLAERSAHGLGEAGTYIEYLAS